MALVIAFIISVILMPLLIPFFKKLKFGQSIRTDGPQSHLKKQGTPTMGGIVFVVSTIITLIILKPTFIFQQPLIAIITVFIGFFIIGLIDDFLIVVKKKNDGLSPKAKLALQALVTLLLFVVSFNWLNSPSDTTLNIFGWHLNLGYAYILFALVMFIAYSNAFNLTDGLDGLCSITSVIAFIYMAIIAYTQENYIVFTFILALIGSLLGFFIFNKKPAKIFMGDTGSLALGGAYAIVAMLLKVEIISIIIGLVFVIETLSVMLQVTYYKKTKKRIFRMAPIHHHFEMGKLGETKTVYLFYFLGIIFGLIGMVIYYV